jgi:Fe-S-cluster-containing hydrogenase component 2
MAVCPENALQLEDMFIDLEDKTVASVKDEHHKKIKYTCSACKPEQNQTPCVSACSSKAIKCIWNPK